MEEGKTKRSKKKGRKHTTITVLSAVSVLIVAVSISSTVLQVRSTFPLTTITSGNKNALLRDCVRYALLPGRIYSHDLYGTKRCQKSPCTSLIFVWVSLCRPLRTPIPFPQGYSHFTQSSPHNILQHIQRFHLLHTPHQLLYFYSSMLFTKPSSLLHHPFLTNFPPVMLPQATHIFIR